jgi:hypothetical protein
MKIGSWALACAAGLAVSCAAGESRAALLSYFGNMNGASESPANSSLGTGTVQVDVDTTLNTMRVRASFAGLTGNTTAAHIHGATAVPGTGTASVMTTTPTFAGFPLGVTSGSMDQTYDLTLASTYNSSLVTAQGSVAGAQAALLNSLANGTSYFNVHTSAFGGGEIRAFLTVPEPTGLAAVALVAVPALVRRRRSARD